MCVSVPLLLTFIGELNQCLQQCQLQFFFFFFLLFRASPAAYGGSQARGQIGAVAARLDHSHSNTRSELHLQSTPQFMATPQQARPRIKSTFSQRQYQVLNLLSHNGNSRIFILFKVFLMSVYLVEYTELTHVQIYWKVVF